MERESPLLELRQARAGEAYRWGLPPACIEARGVGRLTPGRKAGVSAVCYREFCVTKDFYFLSVTRIFDALEFFLVADSFKIFLIYLIFLLFLVLITDVMLFKKSIISKPFF